MLRTTVFRLVCALTMLAALWGCMRKPRLAALSQRGTERSEARIKADRFLEQARRAVDAGETAVAQRSYLEALRVHPMVHEAHLGLGEVYELEGDRLAAMAEYVAQTEVAPKSRLYLTRMLPYVEAKFARDPTSPEEIDHRDQAEALVELSLALDDYRRGKRQPALARLERVAEGLPRAGLVETLRGYWRLEAGERAAALGAFSEAVGRNGYFCRWLLDDDMPERLPGLLERLAGVLEAELDEHPSDAYSALLLGAIELRRDRPAAAVRVLRRAVSWGRPNWPVLFVLAAAHDAQGQTLARDQALADLTLLKVDPARTFSTWRPSLFAGVLDHRADALAAGALAERLDPPAGSYLRWRLFAEAGRDEEAAAAWAAFEATLDGAYPEGEFSDLAASGPVEHQPAGLAECLGAIQSRVEEAMPGFWRCDLNRRDKRAQPGGRIRLRVELGRDGRVAQAGLEENTTGDAVLAYCVVRKLLAMRFPEPIRATEIFQLPVMFGPEVDGWLEEAQRDARRSDGG
jgi:Flp pilus assembly protein TadD